MYARRYYLLIYRRNLQHEYTRTCHQRYARASHQPFVFLRKVTFDLLTFLPFAAYTIFIKFTSFTIHLIHLFTFTFSPFPFLSFLHSPPISPFFHSFLPHNIRDKD